jgi:hypothetical protein
LGQEVRIDWDGKNDLTSEDLNMRESMHGNDTEESNSAIDEARAFLREVLGAGPVPVEEG